MARLLGSTCARVVGGDISLRTNVEMRLLRYLQTKPVAARDGSDSDHKHLFALTALHEIVNGVALNTIDGRDQLIVDGIVNFLSTANNVNVRAVCISLITALFRMRACHVEVHFSLVAELVLSWFIECDGVERIYAAVMEFVNNTQRQWELHADVSLKSIAYVLSRLTPQDSGIISKTALIMLNAASGVSLFRSNDADSMWKSITIATDVAIKSLEIRGSVQSSLAEFLRLVIQKAPDGDLPRMTSLILPRYVELLKNTVPINSTASSKTVFSAITMCNHIISRCHASQCLRAEYAQELLDVDLGPFTPSETVNAFLQLTQLAIKSLPAGLASALIRGLITRIVMDIDDLEPDVAMRSARIVFFLRLLSMFPDATVLLAAECLKLRRIRLLNSCYPVVRALLVYCICPTSDRMEAGLPVSTHLRLLSNVLRNSTFAALLFPEVISRWLIALDKLVLGDCFDISDWQLGIQISRHISGLAVHRCSDIRLTIVNCLVRTTSRLFSWLRLSTLVRGVSDDHETVREASLKGLRQANLFTMLYDHSIDAFWPSTALSRSLHSLSTSVFSREQYLSELEQLEDPGISANAHDGSSAVAMDLVATLIHDKLKTNGPAMTTLEEIYIRMSRSSQNAAKAQAYATLLFSAERMFKIMASLCFCIPPPMPQSAQFFQSNHRVCDEFFKRILSPVAKSVFRVPCAALRFESLIPLFSSGGATLPTFDECIEMAVIMQESYHAREDVTGLTNWMMSKYGGSCGALRTVRAIQSQCGNRLEDASRLFLESYALNGASEFQREISLNGFADCFSSLGSWSCPLIEDDCNTPPAILHHTFLKTVQLLQSNARLEAHKFLSARWHYIQNAAQTFNSVPRFVKRMCQLWAIRASLSEGPLLHAVRNEARSFLDESSALPARCSLPEQSVDVSLYCQLVERYVCGDEESAPWANSIGDFSHAPMPWLVTSQVLSKSETTTSALAESLLRNGLGSLARRLYDSSSVASAPPRLRTLFFADSSFRDPYEFSSFEDLYDIAESHPHDLGAMDLLVFLNHVTSSQQSSSAKSNTPLSEVVDPLFGKITDAGSFTSGLSRYARWCADEGTRLLSGRPGGWYAAGVDDAETARHILSSDSCVSSEHWEALRAIVCSTLRSVLGDNQGCDAVDKATQMVSQLCDLNGSPVNIPDIQNALASAMQLDIDWSSIDVDAVKGFLDAKRFRGSQFLDHAAELIQRALSGRSSESDSILSVHLMNTGHICPPKSSTFSGTWTFVVPQLFALLSRRDVDTEQTEVAISCLRSVFASSPEAVFFPLSFLRGHPNFTTLAAAAEAELPDLSRHVYQFVECIRLTAELWEDKWLAQLPLLLSEVPTRWKWWMDEIEVVKDVPSSSVYSRVMSTVFDMFSELFSFVNVVPVGKYQRNFQERYCTRIATISAMINFPLHNDVAGFDPKTLLSSIIRQLKSLSYEMQSLHHVPIDDVSPQLHASASTGCRFLLPGMGGFHLAGIACPDMDILHTKTRPRRISLLGEDGQIYPYLIKSREDLHLDQRVLQVMNHVNLRLDRSRSCFQPAIPTYEVTPLSRDVGLIRIVDNTVSFFRMYRFHYRGQHCRDATDDEAESTNLDDADAATQSTSAVARSRPSSSPSKTFIVKLHHALKSRGLSTKLPRRQWPPAVVEAVFSELADETNPASISTELNLTSSTHYEAFMKRRRFISSVALSSTLGHVLGIGDRHLGNILLNSATGEVVHIDYAVCFDKGMSLQVKETVPFRLTANVRHALGPFALLGGSFVKTMCTAMDLLRQQRAHVMEILNALIHQPLLQWDTHQNDLQSKQRNLDRDLVFSLVVDRLRRQRGVPETLHGWIVQGKGSSGPSFNDIVASHNALGSARAEVIRFDERRRELSTRVASVEQLIVQLPEILERVQETERLLVSKGSDEQLRKALVGLQTQQAHAQREIALLSSVQEEQRRVEERVAQLRARAEKHRADLLLPSSTQSAWLDAFTELWRSIRPLLLRLMRGTDKFALAAVTLKTHWESVQRDFEILRNPDSESIGGLDPSQHVKDLFATLKHFLKVDTAPDDLSTPTQSAPAAAALETVVRKLQDPRPTSDIVNSLIELAQDPKLLAHMFEGWAAWF
ncbi:Phosphatidylinositol 3- and 4-kinase [Plasmodiophora brassicae]|uniref:Uncharacterized protein n=1 Tax=Plasmodiophora brassicae TaxID=37360 RepID=A0A0G4IJH8_PLABS|nr:hypothetical protein PBRA_004001 [Plasmodiophora brassicae]